MQEGDRGQRPLFFQNVIVLAKSFSLSQPQFDLLNRGLTFIPTPRANKDQHRQLLLDIKNYHRKLQLAAYFEDSGGRHAARPFMGTSTWVPSQDRLPQKINSLIETDLNIIKTHYRLKKERHNLSRWEVHAIRELASNKHIIIKPADKGSAVVVLSRHQYITEATRQLSDTTYYIKLSEPIYLQTIPVVNQILDTLHKKKFITKKQMQFLKGDIQPRERRFYMLPKIHKDPQKWTLPYEIPPGRPIVSDCGSETYRTAEYIDFYLNPLSTKHASYVRDTYHFINMVRELRLPPNFLFFTIDVDSLYTNIDTVAGLSAVQQIFHKYPDSKRPDEELIQLLRINLTKNDFLFNGEYYLQVKGTAMGKKFAPAYANIFMANWEEGALAKCAKAPLHYLRYLDDIWGIWTASLEEFQDFINTLNSHDPSIKLKHEINHTTINFLDTTLYKGPLFPENHMLEVKVYFKDTDTHSLLFKTSFHPKHVFKGLVKSQLLRFHRICTQETDFREAVKILFTALRKRGYSRSFLRHCLKSYQKQGKEVSKDLIPLITSFSSINTLIHRKLKDNFRNVIGNRDILLNSEVISAYRRNKNLKDLLVRAKLPKLQQTGTRKLADHFCSLAYIRNWTDQSLFRIHQKFSPNSSNCVYVIFCSRCHKQYIGETKNSIATRMVQHKYNISHKKEMDTPLVKHFLFHGWQALRVAGLQNNLAWTDKERKMWERKWIFLLNTRGPGGLNLKYGLVG